MIHSTCHAAWLEMKRAAFLYLCEAYVSPSNPKALHRPYERGGDFWEVGSVALQIGPSEEPETGSRDDEEVTGEKAMKVLEQSLRQDRRVQR